jgi:alkyl hydroperoxide reductase subunit AhpF
LDCRSFGGQAGASSRIENYLGFPTGISGMALMARAYNQAHKFGVETAIPNEVIGFEALDDQPTRFILMLASGERVSARSIVIASASFIPWVMSRSPTPPGMDRSLISTSRSRRWRRSAMATCIRSPTMGI